MGTYSRLQLQPILSRNPLRIAEHEKLLDEHGRLTAEHGQLQAKYDQLEAENGRHSTAQNQLSEQLSRVTDELNTIRAELGILAPAGVRSLAEQRESLRTEVQRLRDEHRSTQELCKQFQDREFELTEAHKRLETSSQSMLDAERTKQAELAEQVMELRASSAENARLAEQLIAANSRQVQERSVADTELKAARAQVQELNSLLSESERLNRETAAMLNGIGVRLRAPASN